MENRDSINRFIIIADILLIFQFASEINWKEIRQASISRILYISSVLFSFRSPDRTNPFDNYKFAVDNSGPYDLEINHALDFLVKDEYLKRTSGEDVYQLDQNVIKDLGKKEINKERAEWIRQVIYILGQYGEGKIYDFIFRDPQYQLTIKSNTLQKVNTNPDNETIHILKQFQQAFEEEVTKNQLNLKPQRYLELYFEYVFSKILKRED